MIDFRYHLVSLIAVFLAVALGIVIGTTQLNEPILADIKGQVSSLEQDKRALEDRTQALQAQLDTSDAFEAAVAPTLVGGSLTNRSVLLVVSNEDVPDETVESVGALVKQAGGNVKGTVLLQPGYSDPANASSLQSYVTGAGLPTGLQLPEADDSGQLVASVLAQVLMIPPGGAARDSAEISSVLAGLNALDALTAGSSSVAAADFAVVLTAGSFQGDDAAERNGTLSDLLMALDSAGSGVVVAGDALSADDNGLIGAVRNDPTLSAAISTVDNAASGAGQISTVLALAAEAGGTSGNYGTGEDTQPVPPVPAATP
ncbi:MAG: uncharacterized protein JWQ45_2448 [Blastococcus sp.]|nr:uncharacterized protein [Blastococcus sp.]